MSMFTSLPRFAKRYPRCVASVSVIVFAILLSNVVHISFAQQQVVTQSLEISPPSQEITADPGDIVKLKAKIRNPSTKPMPIEVRIEDFVAQGDEGQVSLVEKGPWAVSTWTTISPTQFTLKPGQSQEVYATLRIPTSGVGGGRYGSFVFRVTGEGGSKNVTSVSQEVASLFLVRVSGAVDERVLLQSLTAPSFMEFGPVPFQLTMENVGNVHAKPYGIISIFDTFGQKVADVVIPPTNVFPQAKRTITVEWDKKPLLGWYRANAIVYTGKANQTVNASVRIFVYPVRIFAAVLAVLVVLSLFRKRLLRAIRILMKG